MGAAATVRKTFVESKKKLLLSDIASITGLQRSEISMSLSYLLKNRYLTRTLVPATNPKGRKTVWLYEYHPSRIEPQA
jgi:DNA-binding transcriptional regulator GbsR (MarR family)